MDPGSLHKEQGRFLVVDVREPQEWEAGHIEGALHIPMEQLPDRLDQLGRGRRIVTVCRSGYRSGQMAEFLATRGFGAENMNGGMEAWSKAGLPMVAERGRPRVA